AILLAIEYLRPATAGEPGKSKDWIRTVFEWLLALSAVSLAVSSAFSERPGLSWFGGNWRQFGAIEQCGVLAFAWLTMRTTAARPDQLRVLLRGLSATACLVAVYGICQYFGWDPLLDRTAYHIGEGTWTIVRPPGTLGYVSYYATYLVIQVFLCGLHARVEIARWWRWLARVGIALCVAAALLSGTRAAVLALAVGGGVVLICRDWRPNRRVMVVAAALAVTAAGFYFSPAGWNLRSRVRWFREDAWGGARLLLWRDSLAMAAHRPIAGFGPEVFLGTFPHYESRALASAYPDFAHESPHNILLDAFVAQGVPGLTAILGFCVLGIVMTRRVHAQDHAAAGALGAALAAGFTSQQFTAFTIPTALMFFVSLAIAAAYSCDAPQPHRRRYRVPALTAAAVLALVAIRLCVADHSLALARRALDARDLRAASDAYRSYRELRLPGASTDLWYSRAVIAVTTSEVDPVARLRWFEEGRQAAIRATTSAEDPFDAWYNAAVYESARNDPAATGHCLRMAIQAHPNWFKPHWTLAQLLVLSGRAGAAEREAALAVALDGGRHPEVGRTLTALRASALHK
ncbi:MAG: O-antigen ligase family protein, partial [Acidobacteriota bacterium]|nr:O-antigen ligase family protein [Acidobacteriota bacterium]